MKRALLFALVAACTDALPPEGQLVVHIATDAPEGLFDRLRVDVYAPGETEPCFGCSRELAVERGALAKLSFGVVPRAGTEHIVRVRLFRNGGSESGEPRQGSTIERFVRLPKTSAEGIVDTTILLPLKALGHPDGSVPSPAAPFVGLPPTGFTGSFPGALPSPCAAKPAADEACIGGGAYWMGSPRLDVLDDREADGRTERVLVLSPFFLDRSEVTVAQMRAARVARVVDDPVEGNASSRPECLYTADAGPNDALPVNCLSWQRANAYCTKIGKRLPTEAELEIAMGAAREAAFPWGGDVPACGDAVFGGKACARSGPAAAGAGARDRVDFGGSSVVDLGGNLREFARDRYRRSDDAACWGFGVFVDPVCDPDPVETPVARSIRGGSYDDDGTLLRAALRSFVEDERFAVSPLVGFRCARDAK